MNIEYTSPQPRVLLPLYYFSYHRRFPPGSAVVAADAAAAAVQCVRPQYQAGLPVLAVCT